MVVGFCSSTEIEEIKNEREYAVFVSRKEVLQREKRLLVSPAARNVNATLRRICYMLVSLAEKNVPDVDDTIEDRVALAACINLLQKMGLKPPIDTADDVCSNIVRNSFEYRQLRNKMIAGLSVIADMVERPASPGTKEFQRGVKEGYRRARDTAVMFLEDIERGEI